MRITGVDLAISNTGIARADGTFASVTPGPRIKGYDRHWHVAERLLRIFAEDSPDLVIVEDYAPRSPGINSTIALAEVGGVVRAMLTRHRVPFFTVKPNVMKLFATGKGNAAKGIVFDAAQEAHAHVPDPEHRPANYDEADAYWLRRMARAHYDDPALELEEHQVRALAGVKWPAIEAVNA